MIYATSAPWLQLRGNASLCVLAVLGLVLRLAVIVGGGGVLNMSKNVSHGLKLIGFASCIIMRAVSVVT